jgi:hydroxyacid-oxoacid transhydrogenase
MDILCHALESYTARVVSATSRPSSPEQRVPYCGANPIADMWSERALGAGWLGSLRGGRAVMASDLCSLGRQMALAATFAGLGFGNAGVHIPHA